MSCGLGTNHNKNELLLCNRGHNDPAFEPVILNGREILLSDIAKYLSIILHIKFIFKHNVKKSVNGFCKHLVSTAFPLGKQRITHP